MIQEQTVPDDELECFDENPLEYHTFVNIFRIVVEKRILEVKERLLKLIKYTKAHDLIKYCVQKQEL